ncbi:Cytochrome P450 82A3-like protein [Drosera capensis]
MARECLGTNDKVFLGRPKAVAIENMGYDHAMFGFGPNGPHWREMRKIATLELLLNQRIEMLKHVRIEEVKAAIKALHDKSRVELRKWFADMNLNAIVNLVIRKFPRESLENNEQERCRRALRDFIELTGTFLVLDALPYLRWLDIGGHEKVTKKTAKELDDLLQGWTRSQNDFLTPMNQISPSKLHKLILGGTDTTTVTLTWAISLLLNKREALKKVQDELDREVGGERQVNDAYLKNLVYLQAVVKETMRLYSPAPLAATREAISDCNIAGYHIPAGTQLIPNFYKIQRDPRVWPNPSEFDPERFLTTHKDVRTSNLFRFEVVEGYVQECHLHFTLANLLHGFNIVTPNREPVDMTEGRGLTKLKATPLEVILTPRLALSTSMRLAYYRKTSKTAQFVPASASYSSSNTVLLLCFMTMD